MTELDRILEEQRRCRDYLMSEGEDKAGAWQGLADWAAEEVLSTSVVPLPANPIIMTTTALDQAIQDATAKEATFIADTSNVQTIKTAIDTATAPLAAAQATAASDAAAFNASLDALSAAALAAKIPTP